MPASQHRRLSSPMNSTEKVVLFVLFNYLGELPLKTMQIIGIQKE